MIVAEGLVLIAAVEQEEERQEEEGEGKKKEESEDYDTTQTLDIQRETMDDDNKGLPSVLNYQSFWDL